jgi:hypothetical protein
MDVCVASNSAEPANAISVMQTIASTSVKPLIRRLLRELAAADRSVERRMVDSDQT